MVRSHRLHRLVDHRRGFGPERALPTVGENQGLSQVSGDAKVRSSVSGKLNHPYRKSNDEGKEC